MKCTAHKTRTKAPCAAWAMRGHTKCRVHGGKTPIGPGSPHFKTGKHSKFLPSRMAATYQDALNDPKLLELRDEIATVDARLIDLLQRVDTGEAGSLWHEAQAAMDRFDVEKAKGHVTGMQVALDQAKHLIQRGAGDYAAWNEIGGLIEQRRKLCDSENRRLTQAHEVLNADQAMLLLAQVVQILQRHVKDRAILGAIAADMQGTLLMRHGADGTHAYD